MNHPLKLSLLALLLSGCIKSPQAPKPTHQDLILPGFEDLLPGGTGSTLPSTAPSAGSTDPGLLANLESLGVRLSTQEITQLRNMTQVQPNGRWAKSQDKTAEQNLLANYKRFGPLFTPSIDTADDYRLQAVTFAEKSAVPYYLDLQYYLDNKQLLVLKWSEASGEFVMIQSDGSLANYLITHAVTPPRYYKIDL